jgi:hypothetical protein
MGSAPTNGEEPAAPDTDVFAPPAAEPGASEPAVNEPPAGEPAASEPSR